MHAYIADKTKVDENVETVSSCLAKIADLTRNTHSRNVEYLHKKLHNIHMWASTGKACLSKVKDTLEEDPVDAAVVRHEDQEH